MCKVKIRTKRSSCIMIKTNMVALPLTTTHRLKTAKRKRMSNLRAGKMNKSTRLSKETRTSNFSR